MSSDRQPVRVSDLAEASFDIIIVGAGPAGCILASRLSENPQIKIALIEAGEDLEPGTEHADLLDPLPIAYGVPGRVWNGVSADITIRPATRRLKKFNQGRGLGGGSTINGSFAFRGQPEDYEGWVDAGATGWGWSDVLPFFRKLETDLDVDNELHGQNGPIYIRREARSNWSPFSVHLEQELKKRDYHWLDDYNGQFEDGYASPPMANLPERRILTASAYLSSNVRQRRNLTILTNAVAKEIVLNDRRATGVTIEFGDQKITLSANEIILSCGAIFSPALLQRSGIGDAQHLTGLGIEVKANLKGVGASLKNHPKIDIPFHLPKASRQSTAIRSIGQIAARVSSGRAGCSARDMGILAINRSSWHALGHQIGALMLALYQPKSAGHVRITASTGKPEDIHIDFALLSHEDDLLRMHDGLAFALQILSRAQERGVVNTVFMPNQTLVAKLQKHNRLNAITTEIIGWMFSNTIIREMALGRGIINPAKLEADAVGMEQFIRQYTNLSHHVCSTCKMGKNDDPDAVLTPDCRVRGITGLRVIDASIFPDIPRAGMFVPVMMAAEKMAAEIKKSWADGLN